MLENSETHLVKWDSLKAWSVFTQSAVRLDDLLKVNINVVEKNKDDMKKCASKTEVAEYKLEQINEWCKHK